MADINANDLFDVLVLQKSSESSEDLGYSIGIKEWTEKKMSIKIDF